MERKYVGLIFVLLGLVIAAGIIYILFFYNFNAAPVGTPPTAATNQPAAANTNRVQPPVTNIKTIEARPAVVPKDTGEEDLKQMASLFAERYGSYSNQSNYRNMRDLEIFMTEKMKAWTENFIKETIERKADSSIYYGISSRAVQTKVDNYDPEQGNAKVTVSTQRRESLATGNNAAGFSQSIAIAFVKQGGIWRVDNATWLPK